jgi:hypothetical protein
MKKRINLCEEFETYEQAIEVVRKIVNEPKFHVYDIHIVQRRNVPIWLLETVYREEKESNNT